MWYTLTGNFGNLLPIDYGSNSLFKKYHKNSLDIKQINAKKDLVLGNTDDYQDEEDDDFYGEGHYSCKNKHDSLDRSGSQDLFKETDFEFDEEEEDVNDENESDGDEEDDDDDDDELKDQLDMHSMILYKSIYNENGEIDEPLITAEQVLNEIENMMTLQVDIIYYLSGDNSILNYVLRMNIMTK